MRMEKVLLSIIALSGLCAVSPPAKRQYYFVYDSKNVTEAQSYCREKFTDLATIDNMDDMEILRKMMDFVKMSLKMKSYIAWIGLHSDLNSWMWSLSDKSFYKPGETDFRRWAPGEPDNNIHSKQHCVQMNNNGRWGNINCEGYLRAVCFDVRGPTVTFRLMKVPMKWTAAQRFCREHYTDVASVRNMSDNQKVQELVPAGENVWIGLFRKKWMWLDGSTSSFTYWNPGEPDTADETCVAADFNLIGSWFNWYCYNKISFICYSSPMTKQVIKLSLLKKNSSLDLNDPAVMESILKQLKQRLKDQGVNDDIKLSWKKQPDGKVFHKQKKKKNKKG